MATRSHIGLRKTDDTVDYIYCHYDGYPEHNGKILIENYTTYDKVLQLLELGNLSVLGKEIGEKQDFSNLRSHNKDWCLAYGRDRGERNISKRNQYFEDLIKDDNVDYAYIFDGDYWECYRTYNGELIDVYEKFSNSQVD